MKLNNQDIAEAVEKIKKFFEKVGVSEKDKMRICFLFEETLIRYQEKFGKDCRFKIVVRKWFGTPKVSIKIKNIPYNPIEDHNEDQIFSENLMRTLSNYTAARMIYRYENGCNEISAISSKENKKLKIPGGTNTIAIIFSIIFALIVDNFFPESMKNFIVKDIIDPILETLLGTVIAVNIPLVFISIVSSVCGIEDVGMLNNLGTKVLKRFAKLLLTTLILTIPICLFFFPVLNFNFSGQVLTDSSEEIKQIFNLILSIIPQNIIAPFYEGKILQIAVLALITGICVTILGGRVREFRNLIIELKEIIFEVVNIIMKIIPLIIFLSIFKTVVEYSFAEILNFWKIIAAEYIAFLTITVLMLLKISIKHKIKISDFLEKLHPVLLIIFTTGSGSAAMPKNIELCKNELKISAVLCDFYIPISHALCPIAYMIGILACTFFTTEFLGLQISIAQLFIIAFLSVQFAISSVGSSNGMIAIMSLLLTQLGMPLDSIGIISATDIFVVNISGVITLIIRDCDLLNFSQKLKIDAEKNSLS